MSVLYLALADRLSQVSDNFLSEGKRSLIERCLMRNSAYTESRHIADEIYEWIK
jgi:hypothetical protein